MDCTLKTTYYAVMDSLTVSTSMLIPSASNVEITPAMLTVLWGIAHEIDRLRIPASYPDAKWLEIPSNKLRNPDGKTDNTWLKECLRRLMSVELSGAYGDTEWGAVIIAQWDFSEGGAVARILVTPAAISAIQAPETFSKIEVTAAYKLKGHARRLYAALADKKNLKKQNHWQWSLDELRAVLVATDKYPRWVDFNRYVLKPALEQVNDFGTVNVKATPKKKGRSIIGVRFDWKWKDIREAVDVDQENERHGSARRKQQIDNSAPPLAEPDQEDKAETDRRNKAHREWNKTHQGEHYGEFVKWYEGQKTG